MRQYAMSLDGKIELIGLEGICLQLYLDSVGVRTIGVGSTETEIPDINSKPWSWTITMQEAMDLFTQSLASYEKPLNEALQVDVTQQQFDALVSIAYNIGSRGAANSTFMKRINANASMNDIVQAILMWDKPSDIIGRRNKEAKLFSTGVYSNGGMATLSTADPITHFESFKFAKAVKVADLLQSPDASSSSPDVSLSAPTPILAPAKTTWWMKVLTYLFKV